MDGRFAHSWLVSSIRSAIRDKFPCTIERCKRTCISPSAVENVVGHRALLDVGIIHIRDLQLPTPGRLQGTDDVKHLTVVHVNPNDRQVALGLGWLLLDPHDAAIFDLGHTEPLWIGHLLEQNLGPVALSEELSHGTSNVVLDDVVTQDDDDLVTFGEVFG